MRRRWLALALLGPGCGSYAPCGAGLRQAVVCVQCGPAGGCAKSESRCVKVCSSSSECAAGEGCPAGVCELTGCR